MPKNGLNVSLNSYDDIFSTEETRQEEQREQVQQIPIDELYPFKDHPFKVIDDEAMQRTVESIKQLGVTNPLIARPRPDGGYEIISGHRRQHAAQLARLKTLPVIVRDMSDDAAVLLMVDSNLQREQILPSERAFAYKMKLDALKRQGARSDLTSSQVGMKLQALDIVGQEAGDSRNQVHRFIRLTNLIPELLDMVDEKKISFNPAVELSYSPTVTLGYCDGWDKLLSGMGSILSIMICLIVVITLSPVFSEEYALHTDSIIDSARYGRTKLTTSKIIAALEVVIGTYLLYLLLNLVLYGCTYGLQGWNVSIQSSLHYASSIYNLTFLQMFFISVILNIFGIVALTTITLFLSAQMSSPVTALITSCVICFLPVVFDFNDSLPVLQKMQEICPIFMLHTNGIFSDMKTYFGMSQPVFMIILNVGLIFVFYRLTKNISKKHQVTG